MDASIDIPSVDDIDTKAEQGGSKGFLAAGAAAIGELLGMGGSGKADADVRSTVGLFLTCQRSSLSVAGYRTPMGILRM